MISTGLIGCWYISPLTYEPQNIHLVSLGRPPLYHPESRSYTDARLARVFHSSQAFQVLIVVIFFFNLS
jgi:hypothetical protein